VENMIVTEYVTISNKDFTKKYSDENRYIVDESEVEYTEAYDLVEYPKNYTEGRPIEDESEPEVDENVQE
jgi:hypothetical protein